MYKGLGRLIYAVRNIEAVAPKFAKFGLEMYPITIVEQTGVRVGLIDLGNDTWIELLEALDPDSPLAKFVEKNGGDSFYGFTLRTETDDLKKDLSKDIRTVGDEVSFPGGLKELLIHPKEAGMFVILEHGSYEFLLPKA